MLKGLGIWRTGLSVLAACSLAATSLADDLFPAPWRAANPSWTIQEWDFVTPAVPLAPDGGTWGSGSEVNPFGTPLFIPFAGFWLPTVGGASDPFFGDPRDGVYVVDPHIPGLSFEIPNVPDAPDDHFKEIWFQLTWTSTEAPGTIPSPDVLLFTGEAFTLVGETHLSDGWIHSVYSATLDDCPPIEIIDIVNASSAFIGIDQVVIETICLPVPEPATMAALGLGALALVRRKAKRP